jgi:hypothetical protein
MDEAAGNMQMGIRTSHEQMPQPLDWFARIASVSLNLILILQIFQKSCNFHNPNFWGTFLN